MGQLEPSSVRIANLQRPSSLEDADPGVIRPYVVVASHTDGALDLCNDLVH